MDKIKDKWQKISRFMNSDVYMGILIGFSAALIVVEVLYLICLAKYGYPANWPIRFPWTYFLK